MAEANQLAKGVHAAFLREWQARACGSFAVAEKNLELTEKQFTKEFPLHKNLYAQITNHNAVALPPEVFCHERDFHFIEQRRVKRNLATSAPIALEIPNIIYKLSLVE